MVRLGKMSLLGHLPAAVVREQDAVDASLGSQHGVLDALHAFEEDGESGDAPEPGDGLMALFAPVG